MSASAKESTLLSRTIIGLYPPSWRERYGDEYSALLSDTGVSRSAFADSLRGATDAWIRPSASVLSGPRRLRATVSVVWWAWIALAAGALLFGQSTEDAPFRAVDAGHPWLGSVYRAYVDAAHVSVLVVILGGMPLMWSLAGQARLARNPRALMLLALPVVAPVAFLLALVGIARIVPHSPVPGVGVGPTWFIFLAVLGLAAGGACAAGPTIVLRRASSHPRGLRIAVLGAIPAALTMIFAAGATLIYAIGLGIARPGFSAAVSAPAYLIPYAVVMGMACLVAATSSLRGLRALRAGPSDLTDTPVR